MLSVLPAGPLINSNTLSKCMLPICVPSMLLYARRCWIGVSDVRALMHTDTCRSFLERVVVQVMCAGG